jgi:phosphoesterase RecJ-like protein
MEFPSQLVQALKDTLEKAKHIVLIDPYGIDGDSIGSHLAWKLALIQKGKQVTHVCVNNVPPKYEFLPRHQEIIKQLPPLHTIDAAILCDQGEGMSGLKEQFQALKDQCPVINIDHHFSNDGVGHINVVIPEATSSTEVTFHLFQHLGVHITPDIATCLLNGIYTDTGSFQHSNTTPAVLALASFLLKRGANFKAIVHHNFHSMPISKLQIWGRVLERIHLSDQQVTVSGVTETDFKETHTGPDALEGVVDFMTGIPTSKFSILLSERGNNLIKGSFRTLRDDIDLSALAQLMNGGGHRKASGFSLPGHLQVENNQVNIVPA